VRVTRAKKGKPMDGQASKKRTVSFDLREMYDNDMTTASPDITTSRYSNLAYVQVSPRDVYIDFLEMPGAKRDGRVMVNGTRIYMSHISAQKLGRVLTSVMDEVIANKGIEELERKKG
jgi:hypothetical protein